MTRSKAQQLRSLFEKQSRFEVLKDTAEHAKAGQDLLLKTSRKNQILTIDIDLAKLILNYANEQLGKLETEISGY